MTQTTLKIDGMMCGMCESHINDAIRKEFPVKMLMYGREAQSKTRIASPATIPKQGNHKAFPPLFRRIILWYNLKYRAVRKTLV